MLLSKLAYLSVKNVIYLNDTSFRYESFMEGFFQETSENEVVGFNHDPDYDTNINNVFIPINEAIARLSDLERIPYKVQEVKIDYTDKSIDLDNLLQNDASEVHLAAHVKEMHAVGQMIGGRPIFVRFKQAGKKVFILDTIDIRYQIYIEYKEEIPYFSEDDLVELEYDTVSNELIDNNIELKDYNLTDSMCNYILEYAQGKLLEQVEPTLANMHVTRAETYFNNIRTVRPVFLQDGVRKVYRIGE